MEFERFHLARDYYYAAVLCAGFFLGGLFDVIRGARRRGGWRMSLGLCFLAGTLAFLGAALAQSRGDPSFIRFLPIPSLVIGVLGLLAIRFPRAAAFPLLILLGASTVFLGYAFARYPTLTREGIPLAAVYRDGNGARWVYANGDEGIMRLIAPPMERYQAAGEFASLLRLENSGALPAPEAGSNSTPRVFSIHTMKFDPRFPLIGGEVKGIITGLQEDGASLFEKPRPGDPWLRETKLLGRALGRIGMVSGGYEIPLSPDTGGYGLTHLVFCAPASGRIENLQ